MTWGSRRGLRRNNRHLCQACERLRVVRKYYRLPRAIVPSIRVNLNNVWGQLSEHYASLERTSEVYHDYRLGSTGLRTSNRTWVGQRANAGTRANDRPSTSAGPSAGAGPNSSAGPGTGSELGSEESYVDLDDLREQMKIRFIEGFNPER